MFFARIRSSISLRATHLYYEDESLDNFKWTSDFTCLFSIRYTEKEQAHYSNHVERILKEFNVFFKEKRQLSHPIHCTDEEGALDISLRTAKFDNIRCFNYN